MIRGTRTGYPIHLYSTSQDNRLVGWAWMMTVGLRLMIRGTRTGYPIHHIHQSGFPPGCSELHWDGWPNILPESNISPSSLSISLLKISNYPTFDNTYLPIILYNQNLSGSKAILKRAKNIYSSLSEINQKNTNMLCWNWYILFLPLGTS